MSPEEMETRTIKPLKVLCDVLVLVVVGVPLLIFFLVATAYHRGFYCDDESLRHPYKDSTVPSYYLYVLGPGLNLFAILVLEHKRRHGAARIRLCGVEFDAWLWEAYTAFMVFCFGALCSQLITDSVKYSIGRLRPHFYTLCLPKFDGRTCEQLTGNYHEYIDDYACTNPEVINDPRKMKEMRLSFPSGHSSFSMYSMLYLAIYLQARLQCSTLQQGKHLMQFGAVLAALLVAMSRVSDYKHHWSDVLAGLALGGVVAIVVSRCVSNLYVKGKHHKQDNVTELNQMNNGNSTPANA